MDQDAARPYTTELRKGRGAVAETLTLLGAWEPGMPSTELCKPWRSSGASSARPARSGRRIW